MSGQSSHLSLKEAKMMQCRVQMPGSHAETNGGGSRMKSHGEGKMSHEMMSKKKMHHEEMHEEME